MTGVAMFSVRYLVVGVGSDWGTYQWKEIACDAVDLDEAMAQGRAYEMRGYIVSVLEDGSQVYRSPMPEGVEA